MFLEIFVIAILIILNGCFAMSELAIVSARKPILKKKAEEGNKNAQIALILEEDTGKFLPIVQIGITLIEILAGAFSGATLSEKLVNVLIKYGISQTASSTIAMSTVLILITYFSLIIGELVPKRLTLRYPKVISIVCAPILNYISHLASPIV